MCECSHGPGSSAVADYTRRAAEYAELLGSMEATAAPDRALVERWARGTSGPLLDLGCGPGHWTAHLAALGYDVRGLDPVRVFIEIARRAHPHVDYGLGGVESLPADARWGGILAWYSLIHLPPAEMPNALARIRGALRPGGTVLLGFFDGAHIEPFDHAVTTAHRWPVAALSTALAAEGLVVEHTERRTDPGARPHAAILARLSPAGSVRASPRPPRRAVPRTRA